MKFRMVVPCIWFEIRVSYQLNANICLFGSTCFGLYAHLTTNAHAPQDTGLQQGMAQFDFIQAITYTTNHLVISIHT